MTAVKSIEEIKILMGHIDPIQDRPNFTNLRNLETQLIKGAKKIEYRKCKYGYAGDIMDKAPYGLLLTLEWPVPDDPGAYLTLSGSEKTDAEVRIKEQKWNSEDLTYRTFMNFRTATRQILENVIPKAFHNGATSFSDAGFGSDTPKQILANLKRDYGEPQI